MADDRKFVTIDEAGLVLLMFERLMGTELPEHIKERPARESLDRIQAQALREELPLRMHVLGCIELASDLTHLALGWLMETTNKEHPGMITKITLREATETRQ